MGWSIVHGEDCEVDESPSSFKSMGSRSALSWVVNQLIELVDAVPLFTGTHPYFP